MTLPTLRLVERRRRRCRLAPDEAHFLLQHHRTHLDLAPTTTRHLWQVTPAGVAGIILTPRRRIIISPKMPLGNILYLLDPLAEPGECHDLVAPADGEAVIELLARQLARRMRERAGAGLHRAYCEQQRQGPFLIGRLDLPAQLRQPPGRKDQLHCRHDEFTCDLPCNQVPRCLAAELASSPVLGEAVRAELQQALAGFASVSETPLTPALLARLQNEAVPGEYRPLMELSLLLAGQLMPGLDTGATPAPTLLVSLERLFEQHLTRLIESAFADRPAWSVSVQTMYHPALPAVDRPEVTIRPDVSIDRDGQAIVVVDAKWKRLAETVPVEDLYQVLGYGTLLGAKQAVLVYPGQRGHVWDYAFVHTALGLRVRTLDVSGPIERCRREGRRWQRELRRLVGQWT